MKSTKAKLEMILDILCSMEFSEFYNSDLQDYLLGEDSDYATEEEITNSLERLFKSII